MLLTEEEKETMAEENYSLIYFIAHKFRNTGYDLDELASVATVGYVKALNTYKKDRNTRFTTYSVHCMRNEILYFLRRERRHTTNNVSLNYVIATDPASGNELSMENLLSDESSGLPSTLDQVELQDDSRVLYKALEHLNENEKYIAVYRFGLDEGIQKTQREIAENIGMSQANVSKIEKGLLVKMKSILEDKYNMYWDEEEENLNERERGKVLNERYK